MKVNFLKKLFSSYFSERLKSLFPVLKFSISSLVFFIEALPTQAYPVPYSQPVLMAQSDDVIINNLTLKSLPPVFKNGQFLAESSLIQELGWDPSTIWEIGENISEFIPLGYFQDNFGLDEFTLYQIAQYSAVGQ